MLGKAEHAGSSGGKRTSWTPSLLSLSHSCFPSSLCVYHACVLCLMGVGEDMFQTGKHFHICLQLGLQESSEIEKVSNHSSSSGFKLLPPKITR